jgi:tetratricopeptide (TPR) repeat protein
VRRYIVAFLLLALVGAASAIVYRSYATDREYARLVAVGDRATTEDQTVQALEAYSVAIALKPESMLAYLKRGRMYRDRGELDAAVRDLRRAVELDPTATLPLELLGDTYLSLERQDRAADRYRTYLALDDRSAPVWYKLALAHYRGGDVAAALRALERSISLDNGIAEAQLLLGLCARDLGDTERAREALETAARLSPALTAPREALAMVYAEAGAVSRSVDQLEALAALDAFSADRFVALGLAHARARRHEAAVLTLGRAVERFPNDPRVYGALGRVWLELAEARDDAIALRKAVEALQTAAAHADVSSEALSDLARASLRSDDLDRAEQAARQAIARRPVHPDAYLQLAAVSARTAQIRTARDALVDYATLVSDSRPLATIAAQIATYSVRLGEAAEALHWIKRAIDESGETAALAQLRTRALALTATVKN